MIQFGFRFVAQSFHLYVLSYIRSQKKALYLLFLALANLEIPEHMRMRS